ncbi:unnamed protein product [Microthlaspi erraticum]|uniref:Uncharacterized protein n=1 Tax=Microthlaspi erraticum TaxID=1685480 RepID=A0A6D2KHE0_9BRAS|nr:unnamed protein product [Microthlaspi erraticum]
MEQKSQITKFPSLEHQNLHFSLKTKPEHPKYDRIFMPSRRPKVMILIWKDRYLSRDPRRSGKRSFGSLVGPELIFYQDMSDERLSRAHGDFDGSRGPSTAPKALAHLDTSITQSRSFHWPERGPFKNLESKLKRLKRNGNFPLLRALNFADLDPLSTYIYLLLASCNKNHQPHNKKHLFNKVRSHLGGLLLLSFLLLHLYLEMNHNTNIHFGNRTLIPHDLHGRSYQDPAVSIVPHPFPPNRAHPTFEGPSRDEHHYHHHQNRPPVYHQPPRPVLHSHHDHVLNRRRDSHFDAVLEGFMESQRKLAATLRQS